MQFYFIRHGQSANNALYDNTRSSKGRNFDPELTELGQRQASLVAQFLRRHDANEEVRGSDPQNSAAFGITHLYCSLMLRAVATGHTIAEVLGLPLHSWLDLHEEGGLYLDDEETGGKVGQSGSNRVFFESHYPQLVLPEAMGENGWWNRPYEELEQRRERAQRFLRELLAQHGNTDDRVAMISHGGFYNLFLAALLDLPAPERVWFSLNNVGVSRFDFAGDGVAIVYMNRVDFLPRNLIT